MNSAKRRILVINAGSATLKAEVFDQRLRTLFSAVVERVGMSGSFLRVSRGSRRGRIMPVVAKTLTQALGVVAKTLKASGIDRSSIGVVAHRVVHGQNASAPEVITPPVLAAIIRRIPLAPLHHPSQIAGIRAAKRFFSQARHVAVYDTLFFRRLPERASLYALPLVQSRRLGIRRYGFHGLSHAFVAREAARLLKRPLRTLNLLTVHLGSGSSIAAIAKGKPVDTSMGFTPLEGLIMATRTGDVDPGIFLFLLRSGMSASALGELLERKSGLLGLTGGFSSDLRDILVAAGYPVAGWKLSRTANALTRQRCRGAVEIFCYRIQKYLGAYAAVLGRVDAIVFTGGIGERSAIVRRLVLSGLPSLRFVRVLTIPTDEEQEAARLAVRFL